MRLWVWRQLRVELPDDWEMLQFTRDPDAGRCGFADRHQFRFELSWRGSEARPDMARTMSDYLAKLRLDETMPDAQPAKTSGWPGIVGNQDGLLTSRFGRYVAAAGCVVEAVLLWPDGRDAELEAAALDGIAHEPTRDGLCRWRAFGMDLLTTEGLTLSQCVVQPAKAVMTFGDEARRREETFIRLGMVDEWLRGTVGDWLAAQAPRDLARPSHDAANERGHAIALMTGTRRPGFLRRARRYESAAWRCPADGRLYCASTMASTAPFGTRLAGGRLACCEQLGLPA